MKVYRSEEREKRGGRERVREKNREKSGKERERGRREEIEGGRRGGEKET